MERARVFVIDDDEDALTLVKTLLTFGDHKFVGVAFWPAVAMQEAWSFAGRVDVVLLDRDLYGGDVINRGIIPLIRRTSSDTRIIGLSGCPITEGVDYDLGKMRITELNAIISSF